MKGWNFFFFFMFMCMRAAPQTKRSINEAFAYGVDCYFLPETLWEAGRHRECPIALWRLKLLLLHSTYKLEFMKGLLFFFKGEKKGKQLNVRSFLKENSSSCYQQCVGKYLRQSK